MPPVLKKILKITLWALLAVVLIVGAFLARLIYIGEPESVASLRFQGFLLLPSNATLSVLDYLTIADERLFVTNESTGSVYRINLHGTHLPQASDLAVFTSEPAAHGVALDPSGQTAYVSRSEVNAVDVFDPNTMKSIWRIPVAEDADGIFFDSGHKLIYVANGDANVATLIDPQTHKVSSTIALGGKPEFSAADPQSGLRYQNLRDLNAVAVVDLDARRVAERWELPGCVEPSGMALDGTDRRLFIVCAANARFVALDLTTHKVVASLPIGGGPDSVAFDPSMHRLYTTGKSGVLSVIQQDGPDSYKMLDTVKLHYGAHTLAVDPATHSVYVGYAGLLVNPRVAMFTPR